MTSSNSYQVLEVCYKCGVKVVTVYAFSLENFNRPKGEVDGLMLLAKTKLAQLVQHGELMERYDARLKICGKRELIPDDVMEIMNRAVEATSKNHGYAAPPRVPPLAFWPVTNNQHSARCSTFASLMDPERRSPKPSGRRFKITWRPHHQKVRRSPRRAFLTTSSLGN